VNRARPARSANSPAERIRGVHDPDPARHAVAHRARTARRTFRRDLPQQWLVTTAYSLMHAAAEHAGADRLSADDAVGLITVTLPAAFTPPAEHHQAGTARTRASEFRGRSA
jgi:hypothetical protein